MLENLKREHILFVFGFVFLNFNFNFLPALSACDSFYMLEISSFGLCI